MSRQKNFVIIGIATAVVTVIPGCAAIVAQRQAGLVESSLGDGINKARQSEARQNVPAMNRAQQAYFLEKNSFASNVRDLGVGYKSETENFFYSITLLGPTGVQNLATPKKEGLKSYTGGIFVIKGATRNEVVTSTIVCESEQPSKTTPAPLQLIGEKIKCPSGFLDISQ